MAQITVQIHEPEKLAMIKVIKKNKGKTISVAKLADQAEQNPNRARFVIDELIAEGRISKVPTRQFNDKYVRYTYIVL
jgi:hypothetical protein